MNAVIAAVVEEVELTGRKTAKIAANSCFLSSVSSARILSLSSRRYSTSLFLPLVKDAILATPYLPFCLPVSPVYLPVTLVYPAVSLC